MPIFTPRHQLNQRAMTRKNLCFVMAFSLLYVGAVAQVEFKNEYGFKLEHSVDCTPVKSQDRTGTCWSYATSSFLESEAIRLGKGQHDLSEMYTVRNIYKDKARNYLLRQGKANFSQGSLAHDPIFVAKRHGIVPESAYSGLLDGAKKHDHGEMEKVMKGMLDALLTRKSLSENWKLALEGVLDAYLGPVPDRFTYQGQSYTPHSFAASLAIDPDDYVQVTSYTHRPFYRPFVLEIPDNYSNGLFYNVPLSEMESIVDNAVKKGYSIAWDGDVSEKGFSAKKGIAVLPIDPGREDLFVNPDKEMAVTQEMRQRTFESYATTDDHLMHLAGIARDKNGTKYYLIKNSWGEISEYKGYMYMSQAYFRLKTVSVLIHKEAIPKEIAQKLNL